MQHGHPLTLVAVREGRLPRLQFHRQRQRTRNADRRGAANDHILDHLPRILRVQGHRWAFARPSNASL